jgi:hypothetical protein
VTGRPAGARARTPANRWALGAAALLALIAAACPPAGPDGLERVPAGEWGGEHVALTVTAGGGLLEFDCAHGRIDGELTLTASGHFERPGVYVRERPGPVRVDEPPDSHPAAYRGRLDDRPRMTLFIVPTDDSQGPGSFSLELNRPARVFKCR